MFCPRSRAVQTNHTFDSLLSRCLFRSLRRYRTSIRTASRYTHIIFSVLLKSRVVYFIFYVTLPVVSFCPFCIFSPFIFLLFLFPFCAILSMKFVLLKEAKWWIVLPLRSIRRCRSFWSSCWAGFCAESAYWTPNSASPRINMCV